MNQHGDLNAKEKLQELISTLKLLWWHFFDWVALISWQKMVIVWGLTFVVVVIMLHFGQLFVLFVLGTIAIKVLAGGKRRAEIMAKEANERAKVESLERRLAEAQIAALQAQVEPHFLFNTLALIGQLIETDPVEAARVHQHLIAYLRSAVPQMRNGAGSSTLGQQIELARAYLAIMQARMKERLTVSFEIPDALRELPFPPMMLQSVVENSIKHGLEPKISGGRITVRASLQHAVLRVAVEDDGVGFSPLAKDGTGFTNIRERLQLLYGSRAQLMVEIPEHGGTIISINLPYPAPQDTQAQ